MLFLGIFGLNRLPRELLPLSILVQQPHIRYRVHQLQLRCRPPSHGIGSRLGLCTDFCKQHLNLFVSLGSCHPKLFLGPVPYRRMIRIRRYRRPPSVRCR